MPISLGLSFQNKLCGTDGYAVLNITGFFLGGICVAFPARWGRYASINYLLVSERYTNPSDFRRRDNSTVHCRFSSAKSGRNSHLLNPSCPSVSPSTLCRFYLNDCSANYPPPEIFLGIFAKPKQSSYTVAYEEKNKYPQRYLATNCGKS